VCRGNGQNILWIKEKYSIIPITDGKALSKKPTAIFFESSNALNKKDKTPENWKEDKSWDLCNMPPPFPRCLIRETDGQQMLSFLSIYMRPMLLAGCQLTISSLSDLLTDFAWIGLRYIQSVTIKQKNWLFWLFVIKIIYVCMGIQREAQNQQQDCCFLESIHSMLIALTW